MKDVVWDRQDTKRAGNGKRALLFAFSLSGNLSVHHTDQIEKYLMKEKSGAAVKIQTHWRGHRERSQLARRQQIAQQVRAAIKIQRAVSGRHHCVDSHSHRHTQSQSTWLNMMIVDITMMDIATVDIIIVTGDIIQCYQSGYSHNRHDGSSSSYFYPLP